MDTTPVAETHSNSHEQLFILLLAYPPERQSSYPLNLCSIERLLLKSSNASSVGSSADQVLPFETPTPYVTLSQTTSRHSPSLASTSVVATPPSQAS